jgi:hypothetical protein
VAHSHFDSGRARLRRACTETVPRDEMRSREAAQPGTGRRGVDCRLTTPFMRGGPAAHNRRPSDRPTSPSLISPSLMTTTSQRAAPKLMPAKGALPTSTSRSPCLPPALAPQPALLPPCVVFDPSLVASDGSPLEPKPLTERATKLIQMLKSPVYDDAAGTLAIVSSDGRIARVHKDRMRYALSVFLDMLDATDSERAAAGHSRGDGSRAARRTSEREGRGFRTFAGVHARRASVERPAEDWLAVQVRPHIPAVGAPSHPLAYQLKALLTA